MVTEEQLDGLAYELVKILDKVVANADLRDDQFLSDKTRLQREATLLGRRRYVRVGNMLTLGDLLG